MYREKLKQIFHSPAAGELWRWSKPVRLPLAILCLLSMLSSGGSLVITMTTKGLIDAAGNRDQNRLMVYAVALTVTVLLLRVIGFVSGRLSAKTNAGFSKDLKAMMLRALLRKKYAGLSKYHSGELSTRMFSDVGVVQSGIMGIVPSLLSMAVSFVGAAWILISMDWRFVILLLVGGALGAVLTLAFREPMKNRHKRMQEAEGSLRSFMQETLENLRILKASGSEQRVERRAEQRQQNYFALQMKNAKFSIWMNTGIGMVFQLSWLFCMLWGGLGIYRGVLTYGSLAAIIQLIGRVQGPFASAADIASRIYSTMSSAERMKELLDLPEETPCALPDPEERYQALREIRFSHVTFRYDTEDVLKDISAVIRPGDFTALTGVSGGGKSTLFQLLLGIYTPTEGAIEFVFADGTEPVSPRTRGLLGYVPQGNYLFSGTLRENLTMFTDSATEEEIMAAAKLACIDEFILGLKDGLDTVIGEKSLGLSEGQAQRIAVARMLLSKAPILLLDESTSALDEETEAKMLENINRLRSKTCIIVTHRRAALEICDHRLHLEQGTLTENR